MKRFALTLSLIAALALALSACGKKGADQTDLTSIHTTAAKETMASTTGGTDDAGSSANPSDASGSSDASITSKVPETSAQTSDQQTGGGSDSVPAKDVTASVHIYTDGKISIEYPSAANLSDASVQNKVNSLLKDQAVRIIKAYEMDPSKDALSVKCEVKTVDRRQITAVYTGLYEPDQAAYPVNVYYTSNVDTKLGRELGLNDYADAYTLAGYVLSGDCQFSDVTDDLKKELMEYKNQTDIETYTNLFLSADFSGQKSQPAGQDEPLFPEVFSYEKQGTIYVSLPVPHALGDYAVVTYTPEGK